jgi:hypothetical protein
MNKPDWFILIDRWVPEGMGEHGVTLPFLVGALAYKAGERNLDSSYIRRLLDEITGNPVDGYVTEVSWCVQITAPILNTQRADSPERMSPSVAIPHPSGHGEALVFGPNLVSRWNSRDPYALIERLVEDATDPVCGGTFSRIRTPGTSRSEYGHFRPGEISYIKRVIMNSQQ